MIDRKRYTRHIDEALMQYFIDHKAEPGIEHDFLVVYKGAMDKINNA